MEGVVWLFRIYFQGVEFYWNMKKHLCCRLAYWKALAKMPRVIEKSSSTLELVLFSSGGILELKNKNYGYFPYITWKLTSYRLQSKFNEIKLFTLELEWHTLDRQDTRCSVWYMLSEKKLKSHQKYNKSWPRMNLSR